LFWQANQFLAIFAAPKTIAEHRDGVLNMTLNQALNSFIKSIVVALTMSLTSMSAIAATATPELNQVRWKSESQIRSLLGEPKSVRGPIGTHASYVLWQYDEFTVAFANKRVFHLFKKDSLTKFEMIENRS
jgi:hypothetical protein